MKLNKLLISIIIYILITLSINSVQIVELKNIPINQTRNNSIDSLPDLLGLGSESEIRVIKEITKENLNVKRCFQYFMGKRVIYSHVLIHEDLQSNLKTLRGHAVYGINNEVNLRAMSYSLDEILQKMKNKYIAPKNNEGNYFFMHEKAEEVIYITNTLEAKQAVRIEFFTDRKDKAEPFQPVYYINPQTLEIIHTYNNLKNADGTGPGGNEKTGKYEYGTDYGYLDCSISGSNYTLENSNVRTYDFNHSTTGGNLHSFLAPRNTVKEINGAYSPLNDAYYFGNVVFDMYKDWYNENPIGTILTLNVHYGIEYENAFYSNNSMTFGDGKYNFYPLVSLDVVSHEVSHGFTADNSNLNYEDQAGGINESFSDMAGEAAEYYMRGSNDFMIGYDIKKNTDAMRYMDDPPKDGNSIGHIQDYYSGIDVHYSSGVYNKAFWALATKPGWTTKKAFDVYVTANQLYWTPNDDFQSAGKGGW